jgi:transposase
VWTMTDIVGEFTAGRQTAVLNGMTRQRSPPRGPYASLKPSPVPDVPEMTARVSRAAFPKGNPYLRLRDELGSVFRAADFADGMASDSAYGRWESPSSLSFERTRASGYQSRAERKEANRDGGHRDRGIPPFLSGPDPWRVKPAVGDGHTAGPIGDRQDLSPWRRESRADRAQGEGIPTSDAH